MNLLQINILKYYNCKLKLIVYKNHFPINLKSTHFFYLIIPVTIFFYSCANQLPPSGGEDDRTPPKIISISPKANTVNFRDSKLKIKFDEYVDRRSFEESFFISPKPKGETEFSWSGKEVEIEFSKSLDKNKTYVIIIGNDLRDFRGGNKITSPLTFAFSTGDKIDKGKISGKVFADNYERIKILAYLINGKPEDELNPEKHLPEYLTQVSPDGKYEFTNLPAGDFRIFAIIDEDRNNKIDKDIDRVSVLSEDIKLTSDSIESGEINFAQKDFDINKSGIDFLNLLKPDSAEYIYSNIKNNEKNIPSDYRFYFYFKNNNLPKSDIVNNFSLTDSLKNKSYRPIFNWQNDSLLEIFFTEKFDLSSELKIVIDLNNTNKKLFYEIRFSIAGNNSLGKVSGKIIAKEQINLPVYVKLYNNENKFITYSQKIIDTTEFKFDDVVEGSYTLVSFIDEDENGKIGRGNYYPFKPAEKFIVYEKEIKVKGGWNVENVFLNY